MCRLQTLTISFPPKGFIYVVNFGLSPEEVDEQYEFAQQFFATPYEEKMKHMADLDKGEYIGYKPFGLREVKPGVPENTEVYNIPQLADPIGAPAAAAAVPSQPAAIARNAARIERFSRHAHEHIAARLLALLAIALELPEDHFTRLHRYRHHHGDGDGAAHSSSSSSSSSYLRYMRYHARTPAQNEALGHVWLRGHSDFGSLTLLFRQPVVALQVRDPRCRARAGGRRQGSDEGGAWRFVRPRPDAVVVNVGDTLEFLSGGFFRSGIHRVVAPPAPGQAGRDRVGVLYFLRAGDDVVLRGAHESPVLRRAGLLAGGDPREGILARDWVAARTIANISRKEVTVEDEELNKIGAGLAPVYV